MWISPRRSWRSAWTPCPDIPPGHHGPQPHLPSGLYRQQVRVPYAGLLPVHRQPQCGAEHHHGRGAEPVRRPAGEGRELPVRPCRSCCRRPLPPTSASSSTATATAMTPGWLRPSAGALQPPRHRGLHARLHRPQENVRLFSSHDILSETEMRPGTRSTWRITARSRPSRPLPCGIWLCGAFSPAVNRYTADLTHGHPAQAGAGGPPCRVEEDLLSKLSGLTASLYDTMAAMEQAVDQAPDAEGGIEAARYYREEIGRRMEEARQSIDRLESPDRRGILALPHLRRHHPVLCVKSTSPGGLPFRRPPVFFCPAVYN